MAVHITGLCIYYIIHFIVILEHTLSTYKMFVVKHFIMPAGLHISYLMSLDYFIT